ncbi:MAG: AmmeMemoRadiSam system protein A [bacterium]|nr:AmmeMemoRadiSam system protein A [bacterium]
MIGEEERRTLLLVARTAIRDAVLTDGSLRPLLERTERSPELQAARGVFVTLRIRPGTDDANNLRGCIGEMAARRPLIDAVAAIAPKAAREDPRFPPLDVTELDRVTISVSVLSPREALDEPSDIVIGVDGVELVCGDRAAVFLPSVASEQGWDVGQLLRHLSLKAGLAADGWRDGRLFRFRSESFGET